MVVVCNLTPVPHNNYRVGVPYPGHYEELLNTDAGFYGGSNVGNLGGTDADAVPMHGHAQSVPLTLPPLAAVILRPAAPPTLDPPGAERAANGRTPRPRAKAGTNA